MFSNLTLKDFTGALASKAPVPGGGGASALAGALSAALGGMVASLTIGKKKYAPVEAEMTRLQGEAAELRERLLGFIEKDAEVFEPLSKAYGMPHANAAEAAEKERVLEAALDKASAVPLDIMRAAGRAVELAAEFAAKGSRIAVSDAGVAALFAKAALEGASLNVFINTKAMKDRGRAEALNKEADALLDKYRTLADDVFTSVEKTLK